MLFKDYVGFCICTTAWELQLFFNPNLIMLQIRTTSISFLFIFYQLWYQISTTIFIRYLGFIFIFSYFVAKPFSPTLLISVYPSPIHSSGLLCSLLTPFSRKGRTIYYNQLWKPLFSFKREVLQY